MRFDIEKITKSYKKKIVLSDVSFYVTGGECVGILGENGSGKSTLLKILAGVISADSGRMMFDNRNFLADKKHLANIVGYVPQADPLIEELTVYDNLRILYPAEKIEKELKSGLLSLLGVGDYLKVPVKNCSGGMKKRLTIAMSVLGNPLLLLLDEPSSALDITCKEKIYSYLEAYKKNGNGIVLITHDIREIKLCDRIYFLAGNTLSERECSEDAYNDLF